MNENVNTLKVREKGFPGILLHIPSPPARLYWLGQPFDSWLNKPKLAVVGSRRMTAYGQGITQKLVSKLAKAGVVIIGGLAYGIDITAHRAALEALIIGLMKQGVTAQDQLALTAKLDSRTLSSALIMLELSGYIRLAGGGHWILA